MVIRMAYEFSLSSRVVLTNGLVFALATAVLAVSPATVSSPPVPSELFVLLIGLGVLIVANALLVRSALVPLDRLVGELEAARSIGPIERVSVPEAGIARKLATAMNDLLDRIEGAQRDNEATALAAQESERSRIAQELHDGVGQSLTAILLELSSLSQQTPEPTSTTLRRIQEQTRESLDEVRTAARRLRPHVLEELGFRSALAGLTTDLFRNSSVQVHRGVSPELPELDPTVELVLFRVAQEALTNVARHSRATTVELTVAMSGTDAVLTVSDDGCGISSDADGTGLRGMRERAALVGGTFRLFSRADGGTMVRLSVPTGAR
jgi:two-component system, NarL family, sensor histidine kinase UhpB